MRHLPVPAICAAALALIATPALARSGSPQDTALRGGEPDYAAAIRADYARDLGAMWDDFHRNPELSSMETRTAAKMAAALRAVPGVQVTEKVGGTGVVGVLKNGAGPVVLVRADMDGLPVEEKSGLPNASKATQKDPDGTLVPVMHACGHDTHIVGLIATARRLAALKDRWSGTIVFVVQPAEERIAGAKRMMEDGLYTRFPKPQYALAYHSNSEGVSGTVTASETIQYSSSDSIDIVVPGIGAHGASPHTGKDPVYMASQIVIALQGLVSRERQPLRPGVITVGSFHAGLKHNIISDRAKLQVTVRANDEATRKQLVDGVKRVARGVGELNGMPADKLPVVTVIESTPTTPNDPALTRRLNGVLAATLGADNVIPFQQKGMGAEDFAYFVAPDTGVKGYYFAVGGTPQAAFDAAANGGPPVPSHHSPLFKVDPQAVVVTGSIAMTAAVLDLMKPGQAN